MPESTTRLLARLSAGTDDAAWEALVERHLEGMRRAAAAAAGGGYADDAVQEAFLHIRERASLFRPPPDDDGERPAGAWLRTIAANCALKLARSARRRQHHEQQEPAMPTAPAEGALTAFASSEERELLRTALAEMPESDRQPIVLRYFAGLVEKERLGAALGCSPTAAGVRLHRAVERLRDRLARLGVVAGLALLVQHLEAAESTAFSLAAADPAFVQGCRKLLTSPASPILSTNAVIPRPENLLMRFALVSAAVLVIAGAIGLLAQEAGPAPVPPPVVQPPVKPPAVTVPVKVATAAEAMARVVSAQNAFAAHLYGQLAQQKPANLAISPHSIATALTLLLGGTSGATHDGIRATIGYDFADADIHSGQAELAKALKPVKDHDGLPYELELANALWLQKGWTLQAPYAALVERCYAGQVLPTDFADSAGAVAVINRWVEQRTHERIKNLITGMSPDARLALVNAVWLKATWVDFFVEKLTKPGPFTTATGVVQTPLMHSTAGSVCQRIPGGVVAVRSCRGGLALVVVTPDDAKGLPALEAQVAQGALPGWIAGGKHQRAEWVLPKLKLEQADSLDLTANLKAMGLVLGGPGDYAGLATPVPGDQKPIRLDTIVHKVFLAVEEKGMEAAAATAIIYMGKRPNESAPLPVHCDRPFLWAIWHQPTKSILFLGRVSDPGKGL